MSRSWKGENKMDRKGRKKRMISKKSRKRMKRESGKSICQKRYSEKKRMRRKSKRYKNLKK